MVGQRARDGLRVTRPFILAVLVVIGLSACGTVVRTTTPSPVTDVPVGNAQVRLHQTGGTAAADVESGIAAAPYASTQAGARGGADGCTLTVLRDVPPSISGRLQAGPCWIDINRPPFNRHEGL